MQKRFLESFKYIAAFGNYVLLSAGLWTSFIFYIIENRRFYISLSELLMKIQFLDLIANDNSKIILFLSNIISLIFGSYAYISRNRLMHIASRQSNLMDGVAIAILLFERIYRVLFIFPDSDLQYWLFVVHIQIYRLIAVHYNFKDVEAITRSRHFELPRTIMCYFHWNAFMVILSSVILLLINVCIIFHESFHVMEIMVSGEEEQKLFRELLFQVFRITSWCHVILINFEALVLILDLVFWSTLVQFRRYVEMYSDEEINLYSHPSSIRGQSPKEIEKNFSRKVTKREWREMISKNSEQPPSYSSSKNLFEFLNDEYEDEDDDNFHDKQKKKKSVSTDNKENTTKNFQTKNSENEALRNIKQKLLEDIKHEICKNKIEKKFNQDENEEVEQYPVNLESSCPSTKRNDSEERKVKINSDETILTHKTGNDLPSIQEEILHELKIHFQLLKSEHKDDSPQNISISNNSSSIENKNRKPLPLCANNVSSVIGCSLPVKKNQFIPQRNFHKSDRSIWKKNIYLKKTKDESTKFNISRCEDDIP